MAEHPSGTVTFLFTDIEGSTKLAQGHPDKWEDLWARHHAILQSAMDAHNGYVFQISGDAFCVAFHTAGDALKAALKSQQDIQTSEFFKNSEVSIRVRMGLHTGSAELQGNEYRGYLTLAKAQRVMSVAYGGQVLLSNASAELVHGELQNGLSLRDMQEHRLKSLPDPERLWQLVAPDLQQDFPALQSLKETPNNLPLQLTSFIGREKEVGQIKNRLEKNRLVTLTGSGGVGKTRLSIQVASELLEEYPNGVWLVELAPITDPALVTQTVCAALDVTPQGNVSALNVLTDYLKPKKTLLVVDNCEHLIDAAAGLCEALLHACPNVRIIASSREALGIDGENAYRVPSLSLPNPNDGSQTIEKSEAVKLFMERATATLPEFEMTETNASVVAQICQRLDGIALAIELAASRVKLLKVEQIASRLDDAFRLLTGGSRTALPRQQTLRALIDWSYNLLSDEERTVLRRLSVFVGGWTLEAAESVCDNSNTLDLLTHLVDKSLVAVDLEHGDEPRYYLLETIRQYAREKLFESGEGEKLRDQHLKAFVDLAEQAEPEIRGHNQRLWLNRLDEELENLRAALEWSQERDKESFLRLASALWRFWDLHGYVDDMEWLPKALAFTEGVQTVTRACALARASYLEDYDFTQGEKWADEAERLSRKLNDKSSLAMALFIQSSLEIRRYNNESALALLEQALTLSKETNDHWLSGVILIEFGTEAFFRNELTSARSLIEQGLAEVSLSGDRRHKTRGLSFLSFSASNEGDAERAERFAQESLACAQEINDKGNTIVSYWALVVAALSLDDFPRAEEFALEQYRLAQALNDKERISRSLINLGFLDWAQGNFSRFAERMNKALGIAKQVSDPSVFAEVLIWAGISTLYKQDLSQAKSRFADALAIYEEENNKAGYCLCLMSFGMLAIEMGLAKQGAHLLGAREKLRSSIWANDFYPFMVRERERYIIKVREQLSEEAFNKAWEAGQAMTPEEAIQYALEETSE